MRSEVRAASSRRTMDLKRRLTLYLFGLIIGGGIAYWSYGERLTNGAWLPEAKVRSRLRTTLLRATPAAEQQMAAHHLDLMVLRTSMTNAHIDFGDSRRTDDSLVYAVDLSYAGKDLHLLVGTVRDFDRDSTATLMELR